MKYSNESSNLTSDILRLLLQLSLFVIYGKYMEEVINYPFLMISFVLANFFSYLFWRVKLRSIPALSLLLLIPWLVRYIVYVINFFEKSFLMISFDMNFFLLLLPVYMASIMTWYCLVTPRFRKYEVLLNGVFLYFLFWKQSHYKISIVPNPAYLALFALTFILVELLVLYLSIAGERGLRKSFLRIVKEVSLFFLILIPLIIYFLLPLWEKYEEGSVAGGGGLLKSSMFRFDFSEYIKLETEISMSDDLVLMYRKEGPAERMLLRRYVLSGYEKDQGFYRHDRDKTNPPDILLPRYIEYENPAYLSREKVKQELFLVNIDPTAFLSMNHPLNSQPIYNWDDSSFARIYQSDAMVSTMRIKEIDPLISMEEDVFNHYTYTGDDEAIGELAAEVTADTPGALLKTMEIENFFHKNYFYSLKPGVAPDGDQLSYFINESQKGYCSYFAFSMALMCRSLGIPARVAVGFWVDPDVSVLNFYPVRADQAHAWVEVYFNDYGWIEFDPTSSTMFPGEQYPFASFTIDEFSPYIEEILDNELIPENLSELDSYTDEDLNENGMIKTILSFFESKWYLVLLTFYALYIFLDRYIYRVISRLSRSDRLKTKYLYLQLRGRLSIERKKYTESIGDYALLIEKNWEIPFVELTDLYQKSVFSPHYSREDYNLFLEKHNETMIAYRYKIPRLKRFLFFVLPLLRSLHK